MSYRDERTITYPLLASIAFHALFLSLYIYFVLVRPETRNVVLNNVDLILQEKEAKANPEKNKTLNFLKLALPQLPKPVIAELPKLEVPEVPKLKPLAPLDIKAPEQTRKALDLPQKLMERGGKLQAAEKLEMDAGRKLAAGPKDAGLELRPERGAQALAPRIELEEVGMKKAPAMPKGLKFEDSGPVVRPQTMQELNVAVDTARRGVAGPQGLAEREGTIAAARPAAIIAAAPQRLTEARDAGVQLAARPQPVMTAETISLRRNNETLRQARVEAAPRLEITGPLSKRKVVTYYAPAFPDWARDRGVLEAAVSVKFFVDNSGRVLDNPAVEKTSGYGALDRLALDAIKRWAFEAIGGGPSTQWGIITFRFVAE
ncbi:MAG TPA: TonB family protein [Elusimicrobiales bacterium]|nr:TonB family protein [Elusimicrobiales bacterium]